MPTAHAIIKSIAIFATVALLINAMVPTLAHAGTRSRDAETDPSAIQWILEGNYKVRVQGAKVRFKIPSMSKKWIAGEVVKMTRDTLVIKARPFSKGRLSGRSTLSKVPKSSISDFEVSLGQHRNTGTGWKIGLGIGLVVAGINAMNAPFDKLGVFYSRMAFLGGPIVLFGTVGGALTKSEKWVAVSPQRLNLSIAPTHEKGLRAALAVNF